MKRKTGIILGISILALVFSIVIGVIIYGAFSPYSSLQAMSLVLLTFLVALIVNLLVAVAILLINGWH